MPLSHDRPQRWDRVSGLFAPGVLDIAMNRRGAFIVALMALTAATVARSGHEVPVYPSYYPHEIELAAVAPERAAQLLLAGKIQAYVGQTPHFAGSPQATIGSIESLGSFVLVRINASSPLARDAQAACSATEAVTRDVVGKNGDMIVHPYPVTPFHGDYLHHVDLAEAAKARILGTGTNPSGAGAQNLKVKATSAFARSVVRPEWRAETPEWDVEVADIDAAQLVASTGHPMNGWSGPAWTRAGWFHASLLLSDQIRDENLKRRIETHLLRLQMPTDDDAVERTNLERAIVTALVEGCHIRLVGYTVKREYFSTRFEAGIENIAYDSFTGFNSPMFIRTVKLKDFPWNGWLSLGIDGRPAAAWNPVAGMTDRFGRLMWFTVGDPAFIPTPNDAGWMLNRIADIPSNPPR